MTKTFHEAEQQVDTTRDINRQADTVNSSVVQRSILH